MALSKFSCCQYFFFQKQFHTWQTLRQILRNLLLVVKKVYYCGKNAKNHKTPFSRFSRHRVYNRSRVLVQKFKGELSPNITFCFFSIFRLLLQNGDFFQKKYLILSTVHQNKRIITSHINIVDDVTCAKRFERSDLKKITQEEAREECTTNFCLFYFFFLKIILYLFK